MVKRSAVEKIGVSEPTLFVRLNRALRKRGQVLKRCRADSRHYKRLGRYYLAGGTGVRPVDLEEFAREIGLLRGWERLETTR